jgi:hypothetical protein
MTLPLAIHIIEGRPCPEAGRQAQAQAAAGMAEKPAVKLVVPLSFLGRV